MKLLFLHLAAAGRIICQRIVMYVKRRGVAPGRTNSNELMCFINIAEGKTRRPDLKIFTRKPGGGKLTAVTRRLAALPVDRPLAPAQKRTNELAPRPKAAKPTSG
jgi:hypothetical protein